MNEQKLEAVARRYAEWLRDHPTARAYAYDSKNNSPDARYCTRIMEQHRTDGIFNQRLIRIGE